MRCLRMNRVEQVQGGRPVAWSSAHLGPQGVAAVAQLLKWEKDPSCSLHALHTCLASRAQELSGFLVEDRPIKSVSTQKRAKSSGL